MTDERLGYTVKIPADISAPDKIMFGATARQCVIIGGAAGGLWLLWLSARAFVPALLFAPSAVLALLLVGIAVSAERDGITADRLLLAALRQQLSPRRRVMAPEGVEAPPDFLNAALNGQKIALPSELGLPILDVRADGAVGLGNDGTAVLAEASTVNFALRTPAEQELLVTGFARWLNSLTGPMQIVSRTAPANLSVHIDALRTVGPALPHSLLRTAAAEHADFLSEINMSGAILHRTLLVAAREPDAEHTPRAVRRISDAVALLAAAEVDAAPLKTSEAHAVLNAALDPDQH